ncbi:hypothetical protein ACFQX6_30085 [Streptosporangium lutulentum]
MAAFQRAMTKAMELAADRATVVAIIPKYTTIKPEAAASLAIGGFPTTLNATRLQRVADTMHEYGLLTETLNVQDLIAAPSGK